MARCKSPQRGPLGQEPDTLKAEWRPFGGSWMLAENETGTSEILTGLQAMASG